MTYQNLQTRETCSNRSAPTMLLEVMDRQSIHRLPLLPPYFPHRPRLPQPLHVLHPPHPPSRFAQPTSQPPSPPTMTTSTPPSAPRSADLSIGAKIGIGVSGANLIVATGLTIYFLVRRKRKHRQEGHGPESIITVRETPPDAGTQYHKPQLPGQSSRIEMDAAPPTPNELPHDHEIRPELTGQLGRGGIGHGASDAQIS